MAPVGLNPPYEAVAAFHSTSDGSSDAPYDWEKVEDIDPEQKKEARTNIKRLKKLNLAAVGWDKNLKKD